MMNPPLTRHTNILRPGCVEAASRVLLLLGSLLLWFAVDLHAQNPATTTDQTAFKLYQQRAYVQALPLFEELYESARGSSFYPFYLQCLLETKDFKKAEKTVQNEIKKTPNQLRLQVDLGYVYLVSGRAAKAEKTFNDAIDELSKRQQETSPLAMAFRSRSLNAYALKAYEKGRQVMKDPKAFGLEIAGIYEATGEFRKMTDAFLDILAETPGQLSNIQSRLQFYLNQVPEPEHHEFLYNTLLQRVQKNPDNTEFLELYYWYCTGQGMYAEALQTALSLVKRKNEDGGRLLILARNCIQNNDFETATRALNPIYSQGRTHPLYFQAAEELLKTRYLKIKNGTNADRNEPRALQADLEQIIREEGENMRTFELMRTLAQLLTYETGDAEKGQAILRKTISMRGMPPMNVAQGKMDLAHMMVYTGNVWEAALLFGQVDNDLPNEAIGHEAKLEYARLMYQLREYRWARLHLEILRGAVNKLIANDAQELYLFIQDGLETDTTGSILDLFGNADLYVIRKQYGEALQTLDSAGMLFGAQWGQDHALLRKARIKVKKAEYEQADTLFARVSRFYPESLVADDALYELGLLRLNITANPAAAAEALEQLIIRYPDSYYALPARQQYQKIRHAIQRKP